MDKKLRDKLIRKADEACLVDSITGSRRGYGYDSNSMKMNAEFNAKRVGKIIESLTDEEREQLKDLKAEDLDVIFAGRRYRPKTAPSKRVRGPVKLGKNDE
jgi:hypothetical protein